MVAYQEISKITARLLSTARPWEYRWRILILFISQPVLAMIHSWTIGSQEILSAPQFDNPLAIAATMLAAIGLFIRVWGTSVLSISVVAGLSLRKDRLITGGPFAILRNPLYLGTLCIFAGYSLYFGVWFTSGFVLFHWLRYERVIRYEEETLRQEWETEFDEYCQKVPRWWPRKSFVRNFSGPFITIDGLLGNSVFLGMFIGFAVSTWSGTLDSLVYLEMAGGAVGITMMLWSHRRRFRSRITAISP